MAAPSEQRIAVPIDDPNADTEWYAIATPPWPSSNPAIGTISFGNMVSFLRSRRARLL